jgi:outer membrane protein assembly factor BamE (lipoprotein component of BamABCDE complex)
MATPALRVLFRRSKMGVFASALALTLSGCLGYDGVINRGAMYDERQVAQLKPGISAQQVLSIVGTPSTTSTVGGESWYYISQRTERQLAFMPQNVTDQRVLAVYFDKAKKVQRIADYGKQDGKTIDFVTRTTPMPGPDNTLVQSLLSKVPFM